MSDVTSNEESQFYEEITLYTSRWCVHSMSVEGFLNRYNVPVKLINIDRDPEAREELIHLNDGFASVPTLVFPDGSKLTEPSYGQIRDKLKMKPPPGLVKRIRGALSRNNDINEEV